MLLLLIILLRTSNARSSARSSKLNQSIAIRGSHRGMLGACWGASTCIRLTQLCKTKQAQTKHRKQGCAPQVCLANASDARSSARSGKLKKGITIRGAQSRGMLGACWGASTCIRITQLCTIKQAQTKHRKQRCASDVYWQMHQTHAALQVQASSNKVSQSGVRARGMLGTCWGASTCIRLTQFCRTLSRCESRHWLWWWCWCCC